MIWIIGSRGIPARYGGFETLAEHLQRGLEGLGLETTVIGTRDPEVQATRVARWIRRSGLWALETPVLTWTARPRVRTGDSVLVLNPVNVWTAKWLERRGAQVVLHLDGMEHLRTKWGRAARTAHRLARRTAVRSTLTLIADHPEIQRSLLAEFGRKTVWVSYGGCDVAERDASHRWLPQLCGNHFLVVARPEPENQVLEICEAFASTETDARLLVVGGPSRRTDYWRRIELAAATDSRIELLGSVWDRQQLCQLMMSARAYIHGHTVGGTNPSLVDVMSHGTPILAHDNLFNRGVAGPHARYWKTPQQLQEGIRATTGADGANQPPVPCSWRATIDSYAALLGSTS